MSQFFINNERQMADLAARIALEASKKNIYTLTGTLGAGKSFFARNFINSLQITKDIILSPTFNIVNFYESSKGTIYHFDLYRINNDNELENIGFFDYIKEGICLIEWPEIALKYLPKNYININISHDLIDNLQARIVKISYNGK